MHINNHELNKKIIKNIYPLPRINDMFDQLKGTTIFLKINLRSGYHHLKLKEGDVLKLTFWMRFGHYECLECRLD